MLTTDDKLFCVLHSCDSGLARTRLPYYMYVFQHCNVDFSFSFNFGACGLMSRGLDAYVSTLINEDMLEVDDTTIRMTEKGIELYRSYLLTMAEWDHFDYLFNILSDLSDDELHFTSLVIMLIDDIMSKKGANGLITDETKIKSMLQKLSRAYSDDNFNGAVRILRIAQEEV